jgi:hypothetical protein
MNLGVAGKTPETRDIESSMNLANPLNLTRLMPA